MSLFGVDGVELLPTDGSALLYEWVLGEQRGDSILDELVQSTKWQSNVITMFGKQHREPRLTAWHGDPCATYRYSGITLTPQEWTPLLLTLKQITEQYAQTSFNSVLLNYYRDGNDKMGWHADNEPELGREPVIGSLSLGSTRRFRFRHRVTRETVECDVSHGSLVVMSGLTQSCWVHSISQQKKITEPRINLTFRSINQT